MILLLSCLGVPDEYFIRKQQQAKEYFDLRCIRERLDIAIKLYKRNQMKKKQLIQ